MIKESHKQIVLVTGSSGCLGQHIVKLLHENDDTVQEIRCFDIKPFQNNLRKEKICVAFILFVIFFLTSRIQNHQRDANHNG